ncbi:O-antigen ligase family protein [Petroclostridium sp. X23]|uniref:O-antigen ligase family protein n=1 Tax=Petroclostridium sp. X23 TaxID=3045146 RepID=UPI0024ADC42D|nr:O-antigen ligase family protein [Petroclostridium sp. X23]WHH57452.1 O-antigen ligase family protein [Petroclostridium sp. X23]
MLTTQDKHNKINIEAAAVMLFFITAVFFQGLYFFHQYIIANIFILIYTLYIILKQGRRLPVNAAVVALFIFWGINVLSVFYGANSSGAANEALRILAYLPAFVIGWLYDKIHQEQVDKAVIISGVSTSFIGLLNLSGILLMDGTLYGERMQSTFQYANVTAVYLMIGIVLCIKAMKRKESGKWKANIINLCIYVLTCGLILTYSRGMWIIFAVFNVYLLLSRQLAERINKIRYIYLLMVAVAASVFLASLTGQKSFVLVLFIGAVVCMLPEIFSFYYYSTAIRLLAAGGFAAASFLHNTIVTRLSNISFNATEWTARTAYYKGALRLVQDYRLFGSGAMGWAVLCEKYAGDYVKYVHNYYLQVLTDVGLVGAMFLFLFIISVAVKYHKNKRKDSYSAVIVITIFIHSMIDIDMHFQLIAIIFFLYCGFLYAEQV